MVLDLVVLGILGIAEFLKGVVIYSIPSFVLVVIGLLLRRKLAERYKLTWVKSSLAVTYAVVFVLLVAVYFWPMVSTLGQETIGVYPGGLEPTFFEMAFAFLVWVFRLLIIGLVLSVLLVPLEFISLLVYDKLGERFAWHYLLCAYLATLVATVIAAFVLLFLFPWAVTGLVYAVFFGFG